MLKSLQRKKARIKVGDVIKSYADKEVKFSPDLIKMIANNKQKTVSLSILRDTEAITLEVPVGPLDAFLENH